MSQTEIMVTLLIAPRVINVTAQVTYWLEVILLIRLFFLCCYTWIKWKEEPNRNTLKVDPQFVGKIVIE